MGGLQSSRRAGGLLTAAVAALAIAAAAPARADDPRWSTPKNVVVVHQFDPALPVTARFLQGIQSVLDGQSGVLVYSEHLDLNRLDATWQPEDLARWYASKYASKKVDLVVAAGADALEFVLRARPLLWSDVPVVFCAVERSVLDRLELPADVTGTAIRFAVRETLEVAMQLLPDARRVAFFSGSSRVDLAHAGVARHAIQELGDRLQVVELAGLSYEELADRLGELPDGTFAFGLSVLRDRTGRHLPGPTLVPVLAARTRAPLFAVLDTVLGSGIVGGWLTSYEQIGRDAGATARRVLAGDPPSSIPITESTFARLAFDGRQLDRWGIPESRLPAGSAVLFRAPSPWRSRPGTVIALGITLLVQAGLIVALLLQRRSRRRAEAETRDSRARVAHLNRVSVVGELAGTLAHEVNKPLAAILNDARAARRFLDAPTPQLSDARAAVLAVESHGQRARDVLLHVRSALRKEAQPPRVLDLSGVVREAVRLAESDARDHDVGIALDLAEPGAAVECDEVQIQQVVLNLLLNALDAAREQSGERRRVEVTVATRPGSAEVAVRDWGRGIAAADRSRLFEPFFTTKRDGLGLGLSISRTIVEAHGGRISMDPALVGSTFRFSLPLAVEHVAAASEAS